VTQDACLVFCEGTGLLGADYWYVGFQADGTAPEDKVTFCQECGNNVHVECFKRWTASKKGSGEPVTCVYCRCPWVVESGIAVPTSGPNVCYLWHAIWQHSSFAYTCSLVQRFAGVMPFFPSCGGQPSSVGILPQFSANVMKSVPDVHVFADVLCHHSLYWCRWKQCWLEQGLCQFEGCVASASKRRHFPALSLW